MRASSGLKFRRTIRNELSCFTAICLAGRSIHFPGRAITRTSTLDDTPDGALKRRQRPEEPIVNYVSVNSVDKFADKIAKLGGKVCMAKTAVPQMGYFAVCQDTEGNSFGLWESDANAK